MATGFAKLTITAWEYAAEAESETAGAGNDGKSPERPEKPGSFVCQVNPETFAVERSFDYGTKKADGSPKPEAPFAQVKPRTFSVDILLDGTGALPLSGGAAASPKDYVHQRVKDFEALAAYNGTTHRPHHFQVNYAQKVFTCVLLGYTVTYSLFRRDGSPLRATIATSWREFATPVRSAAEDNLSSPDVSHAHVVRAGDTLAGVAQAVYRDPLRYAEVAHANGLDTLRRLAPGRVLLAPTLTR